MVYRISFVFGVILLVAAFYYLWNALVLLHTGERAIATVVEVRKVKGSGDTFESVFQFSTREKKNIFFIPGFKIKSVVWNLGETETIVYNPENLPASKLLTYYGVFGFTVALFAVGLPMLIIGGGYCIVGPWLKKRKYPNG